VEGRKDGPAANRNNGAKQARGEWIAFVDDDCLPQEKWLGEIARIARENRVDVIEGKTLIPDKVDSPFRQGVENSGGGVFWSCNLAIRRTVFERLGGFDEDFKEASDEDMEFGWRLRQRGCSWCFAAEALVLHPVRVVTWAGIWKKTKMRRWGELLAIKTGRAPSLDKPAAAVALQVAGERFLNLFRTTWHLVKYYDRTMWRTRLFWQVWEWLMFPFLFFYALRWHFRFRNELRARAQG
jgi:GT2 family glycosyltransferase